MSLAQGEVKKGGSELLLNEPPVFAPLGGGGANASTRRFFNLY
jgi:hypothetical protein